MYAEERNSTQKEDNNSVLTYHNILFPHARTPIFKTDGWGYDTMHNLPSTSFKGQVIGMLHACTYARVPLIFLNTVVIAVKLVFG